MLEYEWIESQYEDFGETYINDLMDKGFVPVKTHRGYRWVFEGKVERSREAASVLPIHSRVYSV